MEKEKILVLGVEVEFNDLLENTQKRLYLQDSEKFEEYAAKSQFTEVRKLVIKNNQASSTNLDEIFKLEIEKEGITNLTLLWNHPNFQKDNKKRRILEKGKYDLREILANDKDSSSDFLNEMIRGEELQKGRHPAIMQAILKNKNFKMENETRKMLAKDTRSVFRVMAAKDKNSSSEFLNEMLRRELQNENNEKVIETIMANKNFKMEVKTREMLAEDENFRWRKKVAEDKETPSKLLNQMLQEELNYVRTCESVIVSIIANKNFKIEDETLEMLYEATWFSKYRIMLARDKKTSYELLEKMYSKETDEKALEVIELNMRRILVKQIPLHN